MTLRRRASPFALALALLAAAPALAYLPPATAILKRVAQRRDDLGLSALEVRGTLVLFGDAAAAAPPGAAPATAPGASPAPAGLDGHEQAVPVVLLVKWPGRCRLELAPAGAAPAAHPVATVRGERLAARGLDAAGPAAALLEGACALLGERGAGGTEPERHLARRLAAAGVSLTDVAMGRMNGRVAWVLGGRPQGPDPQAWVDKQAFQPVRLVATLAGARRDVRLLDFGSPVGGELFPRAVEVWNGPRLEARFTPEKVTPNPKLPDALF